MKFWLRLPWHLKKTFKSQKSSKLATSPLDFALPLTVKSVPLMRLEVRTGMMKDEAGARFHNLFSLLGMSGTCAKSRVRSSCFLSVTDIALLKSNDIIERLITRAEFPEILPFTPIEENESGKRRRFIALAKGE